MLSLKYTVTHNLFGNVVLHVMAIVTCSIQLTKLAQQVSWLTFVMYMQN